MKTIRKFFLYVLLLAVTGGCAVLWLLYGSKTSNPHNYATVGDIPVPWGYERIAGNDAAYSSYLRSLPLKGKGSKVQLFTGGESRFQSLVIPAFNCSAISAFRCYRMRSSVLMFACACVLSICSIQVSTARYISRMWTERRCPTMVALRARLSNDICAGSTVWQVPTRSVES